MANACKVCASVHREQIEIDLVNGVPVRTISEKIPHIAEFNC